ncbi:hypothetical protein ACX0G7_16170 [Flavitalea antarctica]
MKIPAALISGFSGAVALTLLHEALRKTVKHAPRMDRMGEEAIQKIIGSTGHKVPSKDSLFNVTMAGDVAGNAMYYSMISALPVNPVVAGAGLGLAAGIGAVLLPEPMGLNEKYSNATTRTQVLTIAIYLAGGIVAGLVHKRLKKDKTPVKELTGEGLAIH